MCCNCGVSAFDFTLNKTEPPDVLNGVDFIFFTILYCTGFGGKSGGGVTIISSLAAEAGGFTAVNFLGGTSPMVIP